MTTEQQENPQEHLIVCQASVTRARDSNDMQQVCLALIDLGSALFQTRMFEQGVGALDEAEQLAATLDDSRFLAHCLGLKAAVYQDIGRFHNAYEVIERVVAIAEVQGDLATKCDAFITQGQILANSGDPVAALDKLKDARALANQLDDKRHVMKVLGALGNIKTTMVALDDAQTFFEMAATWAAQLGDQRAECGYILNLGTVFVWQKQFPQALPVFERALALAQTLSDREAELAALRHLTESLHKLERPDQVVPLARQGIALSRDIANPSITFSFFETLVLAFYRMNQPDNALTVIREAIEHARTINDLNREVNMLLQLGESCMAGGQHEQARQAYQQALEKIQHLDRESDEAHLVGRLGVVLAESGRMEEAIDYHQRAVELARQRVIPELEGEQLAMLALAYRDQHELEQAQLCCRDAIRVYSSNGLDEEADRVRQLLAEFSSGTNVD